MKSKIQILEQSQFPTLLREIHRPPEKIYFRGQKEVFNKTMIAVVGTRRNSEYGAYHTKKIINELAVLDVAIVSGLAAGIDTIAHKAALQAGLPTIAVLGSGLGHLYPTQNRQLAQEITKTGLIISQFPPDAPPTKHRFPQRNQIISGLSIATLVIEAPERSGALITANFALAQGREIFALPADVDRPTSHGILHLLQKPAAHPIKDGHDIIQSLSTQPHLFRGQTSSPKSLPEEKLSHLKLTSHERLILQNLTKTRPTTFQCLQSKTKLPTQKLLTTLTLLELSGLITQRSGRFLQTHHPPHLI